MLNKLFPTISETGSQSRPQRHGNISIESTQMGWFPSKVSHRDKPELQRVNNTQWNDGILLSELVSQLLIDERGLVKQIDQFDDFGRPRGPPRLLLVGTEAVVKSRAQALHNIRLSLKTLQTIPNFPHISFSAEEVLEDATCRHRLMRVISLTFNLPPISIEGHGEPPHLIARQKRMYARRSASAPPAFGRIRYPPMPVGSGVSKIQSHHSNNQSHGQSRYYQHIQPPPRWSSHAQHGNSSYDGLSASPSRVRPSSSSSQQLRGPAAKHVVKRTSSPEPRQRGVIPQPTPSFHRLSAHQSHGQGRGQPQHRSRSVSPPRSLPMTHPAYQYTSHNKPISSVSSISGTGTHRQATSRPGSILSAKEKVRAVEMQRERLKVQQRDRHRRSVLLSKEDQENTPPANSNAEEQPSSSRRASRMTDIKANLHLPPTHKPGGSSVISTSASILSAPHIITPTWMWQPPKPSSHELTSARNTPLDSITTSQQTAVKDWLALLGLPLQNGEGGFFPMFDCRLEGSVSVTVPTTGPPPLPLHKDRLRNGQLLLLLLCNVEPALAAHAQLPRLLQYLQSKTPQSNTLSLALETVEKALWLFKLRRCPPLPMHLLTQPELFVQGKKEAIWGLLFYIMQSYGPADEAINLASSQLTGALQPLPHSRHHHRRLSVTSLQQLLYTPQQRRALDQSLLDWLENNDILTDLLGSLPRPTTILALESFVKDGSLLHCLLQLLGFFDGGAAEAAGGARSSSGRRRNSFRIAHTFSQAVGNIIKSLTILRGCRAMPTRFIYPGIEEEIARGNWDAILGLLEDMHFLYDRMIDWRRDPRRPQQQENVSAAAIPAAAMPVIDYPYLGPTQLFRHLEEKQLPRSQDSSFAASQPHTPLLQQRQQQQKKKTRRPSTVRNTVRLDASYLTGDDSNNLSTNQLSQPHYHYHHQQQQQARLQGAFQPVLDIRNSLLGESVDTDFGSQLYERPQQNQQQVDDISPSIVFHHHGSSGNPKQRLSTSTEFNPVDSLTVPSPDNRKLEEEVEAKRSRGRDQQSRRSSGGKPASRYAPSSSPSPPPPIQADDQQMRQQQQSAQKREAKPVPVPHRRRSGGRSVSSERSTSQQPQLQPASAAVEDPDESLIAAINLLKPESETSQKLSFLTRWANAVLHNGSSKQSSGSSSDNEELSQLQKVTTLPQLGQLFADGVLLARIVQRLERRIVPGLEMRPKTTAHRLQNVRRTLEMLAECNRRIPLRALSCEEAMLQGDGTVVLTLLEALHKAHPLFVQQLQHR